MPGCNFGRDVEGALQRALDPSDVLPMLHRLSRAALPGSEESVFAHRQLAELLIERHPWRATIHARRVLAALPGDDRAWAVVAASQAMLGHYRFAITAYKRALDSAPKNPSYAHNLGHLLDVAVGRPKEAVPWLQLAYSAHKDSAEITPLLPMCSPFPGRSQRCRFRCRYRRLLRTAAVPSQSHCRSRCC